MSVYDFEGRLSKTLGKDKLYFSENVDNNIFYWSNKFVHQIKRVLVNKGVVDNHDYELSNIHNVIDEEYINFNQFLLLFFIIETFYVYFYNKFYLQCI